MRLQSNEYNEIETNFDAANKGKFKNVNDYWKRDDNNAKVVGDNSRIKNVAIVVNNDESSISRCTLLYIGALCQQGECLFVTRKVHRK